MRNIKNSANANSNTFDSNPEHFLEIFEEHISQDKYEEFRVLLQNYSPMEIVNALDVFYKKQREIFFCHFLNAEILVLLAKDLKQEVIDLIGVDYCAQILRQVSGVKVYMFLESLPQDIQYVLLMQMPQDSRSVIEELLSYPDDSAGKMIDKEYILLPSKLKVGQVIGMLHNHRSRGSKGFYQLFVVDSSLRPLGVVSASDLLYESREKLVSEIMSTNFKTIQSGADQQEVVRLFCNHSLFSLAVVDVNGSIAGVIYADDVIDVIQEEASEDLRHFGGVAESDVSDKIWAASLKRVIWLLVSFVAINCASLVVSLFNEVLSQSIELAALMPVIAAMGGNAGLQSSTVSVGLLIEGRSKSFSLFRKELVIGVINGLLLAVAMLPIIMIRFNSFELAISFGVSLVILFSIATSAGAVIPVILSRLKLDPCLASTVITSALTDILAIYLLLKIASFIIL